MPLAILGGAAALAVGLGILGSKLGEEIGTTTRYALIGGGAFLLARHFKVI